MIGLRNRREVGASLMHQPFFLLDNQVVRVFRLKDRLIILRTVTYEFVGGYVLKLQRISWEIIGWSSS